MEKKLYKKPEIKSVEIEERLLDAVSTGQDKDEDRPAKKGSYDFDSEANPLSDF